MIWSLVKEFLRFMSLTTSAGAGAGGGGGGGTAAGAGAAGGAGWEVYSWAARRSFFT